MIYQPISHSKSNNTKLCQDLRRDTSSGVRIESDSVDPMHLRGVKQTFTFMHRALTSFVRR